MASGRRRARATAPWAAIVADQALADPQPGLVHRLRPQALGREQLEHLAGAHDVDRADLGHDVGGDHARRCGRAAPAALTGSAMTSTSRRSSVREAELGARRGAVAGRAGPPRPRPGISGRRRAGGGSRGARERALSACSTSSARIAAHRLLARDHADALAGHQRAVLDVAVDHRAAQRAGPEMLDRELRLLVASARRASKRPITSRCVSAKRLGRRVGERAHRDHRERAGRAAPTARRRAPRRG